MIFIRTSSEKHHIASQNYGKKLKNNQIYLDKYGGGILLLMNPLLMKMKLKKIQTRIKLGPSGDKFFGLKKQVIFLNYQIGLINFWNTMIKIQILLNQNQEEMK